MKWWNPSELRAEVRPLLRLAVPLVLGEIGWVAMSLVDTIMVGRLGKEAMAGVSEGHILFYATVLFGMGLMLALDALVSQAFGAGDVRDCHRSLVNAIWISLGVTLPLMALQWVWIPLLERFGVHPAIAAQAGPYLKALAWSVLPLMLYAAFRRYLQGMNLVSPVLFALVSANAINAVANWILIFGKAGMPRLGAEGAGWATTISRVYMAGVLIAYTIYHARKHGTGLFEARLLPDRHRIRQIFALGVPAATQMVVEVGLFALAATLLARLEPVALAAHQVALSVASFTYMVPLGISSAAAVRVGQAIGAGNPLAATRGGWTAIAMGVAFMGLAGSAMVAAPRAIAGVFTSDQAVVQASGAILLVAAVFQLFDGAQAVATGALRGAGNTRTAAICHLVAYWIIGLPVGYVLCFHWGWGVPGMWIGLCIALILIGIVLAGAWWKISRELTRAWHV